MDAMDDMVIDNDWSEDSDRSDDNGSVLSSDDNMSDDDGHVKFRTYKALDPPRMPPLTDWSQQSWQYTSRRDARNGFEVRQMNVDQFGETELGVPEQWPAEYKLGPPSMAPDWHPLIEKYGLQVLKKAGFINYVSKDPNDYAPPKGKAAEERNPGTKEEQRIHPIFRQEMWKDLEDEDYALLEPALLIASAYLDDMMTLNFFHAVAAGATEMGSFDDLNLGLCKIATIPATLPGYKQIEAHDKVLKMCDWTSWKFESVESMVKRGSTGQTSYLEKGKGKKKRHVQAERHFTYQSEIIISEAFLEILQQFDMDVSDGTDVHFEDLMRTLGMGCVPENRRIKIDVPSAIKRTNFLLATVLLHEFAHAFVKAWHQVPRDDQPTEPWINGNRCNESGHAFTNFIMGGCPEGISAFLPPMDEEEDHRQILCAPFGIYFSRPWDQWAVGAGRKGPQRVMAAGTPLSMNTPLTVYPVFQRFIHNLSTKETWEQQVPRYGLRALQLPGLDAWSVKLLPGHRMKGLWCTGEDRWGDFDNEPRAATWR